MSFPRFVRLENLIYKKIPAALRGNLSRASSTSGQPPSERLLLAVKHDEYHVYIACYRDANDWEEMAAAS